MKPEENKLSPLSSLSKKRIRTEVKHAQFRAVTEPGEGEGAQPIRKIRGYAILFDVLGTPWRGSIWREKVSRSALDNVDLSNVPVLWDHNTAWVLGRSGKNARLEVDDTGLFVEVTLGYTWFDDYVFDRVSRELVDGMSFYFDSKAIIATDWENKIDVIAQINEIYEVSVLAFPAYDETLIIAEQEEPEVPADPELTPDPEDEALKAALIKLIEQL